ncbi:MAG: hypothetical protein AB1374_12345 [Bacillota bacterium]
MRRCLSEKGVTLIEAIVAATLLTIVVCGALLLYERGVRSWVWTEQNAEVVDNLRIAVDKVAYDVRMAAQIVEPVVGVTDVPVLIVYDAYGRRVKYERDTTGELERNSDPVTTPVITAVYFSRPSEALVKIELRGKERGTTEVSVRTAAYACSLE